MPLFIGVWRLGSAPMYLGGDEAHFANHAYSIAKTGRDLDGQFMPLFFRMEELSKWYQPMLFYLIAVVLKFMPLTEGSTRMATALVGVLDVVLVYAVGRKLFPHRWQASLGALALALSPSHVVFARQALDYICPLPFLLGWLWCLLTAIETGSPALAAVGGLLLGMGFYSYIASWVMMPLYLALTWIVLWASRQRMALSIAAAAGFACPLLVFVVWLRSHPDMLQTTVGAYRLYDARHLSPLQGVKDFLNYNNVQERIGIYWDYFNPSYLFFSGGSNLTQATRRAGVFLVPAAVFLVFGVYALVTRHPRQMAILLVTGFLSSPLAATLIDGRYAIQRELFILPFGALITVFGVMFLLQQPRRLVRLATVLLLIASPLQFAYFYTDYLTGYRFRSAEWFDPANFRGIAEYVLPADASAPVPAVYLSDNLDDGPAHWRFYLTKHHREDLRPRTQFFVASELDVNRVPPGSLLVFYASDPRLGALVGAGKCCRVEKTVDGANGSPVAVILRKPKG